MGGPPEAGGGVGADALTGEGRGGGARARSRRCRCLGLRGGAVGGTSGGCSGRGLGGGGVVGVGIRGSGCRGGGLGRGRGGAARGGAVLRGPAEAGGRVGADSVSGEGLWGRATGGGGSTRSSVTSRRTGGTGGIRRVVRGRAGRCRLVHGVRRLLARGPVLLDLPDGALLVHGGLALGGAVVLVDAGTHGALGVITIGLARLLGRDTGGSLVTLGTVIRARARCKGCPGGGTRARLGELGDVVGDLDPLRLGVAGGRVRSGRTVHELVGGRTGRGVLLLAAAHAGEQHLRHVDDLDVLAAALFLGCGQAVAHHHAAEGATDGDALGTRVDGLLGAVHVDPRAELLLHPHAGTTGATAEGLLLGALHLPVLHTRQRGDQLTRRLVDLVVAAQVAGVVVGHRRGGGGERRRRGHLGGRDRLQLLLAHEAVQQLRVVHDLVLPAVLRVLVLDGVEAVRAGHHDLRGPHLVQHLHVLLRQHLVQHLVAGAACGVTGAGLAVTQDGEVDPGDVQQLGDGLRGLLRAVLEGAGATHPEEVLDLVERLHVRAHLLDGEVQALGPVHAGGVGHAPGVLLALEVLEQATQLAREGRLDEHLVTAHVHDGVDVLDVHRALLHARTTAGAAPQHVGVDDGAAGRDGRVTLGRADQLADVEVLRGARRHLRVGVRCGERRALPRRLGVGGVAQVHHQHLRRERLLGVPGRALLLAAAALGAGGEVQQALPGEVLDGADTHAQLVVALVGLGDLLELVHARERLAAHHHRLQLTQRGAAVGVTLEPDVEEGQEAVPGHAHRGLQADGDHPRHRDEDLDQRHGDDQRAQRAGGEPGQRRAHPGGQREVQGAGVLGPLHATEGVLQGTQGQDAQHDAEDRELDVVGLPEGGTPEAAPARVALLLGGGRRLDPLAQPDQVQDPEQAGPPEELGQPLERGEVPDEGQREVRVEQLPVGGHQGQEQHPEADHGEPVGDRHPLLAQHAGVREDLVEHGLGALHRVVEAPHVGLALADHGHDPHHGAGEQGDADGGDGETQEDGEQLQGVHGGESTDEPAFAAGVVHLTTEVTVALQYRNRL